MKMHLFAAGVVATLAVACATVNRTPQSDPSYPGEWPQLVGLGPTCAGVNGTYENEGVAIDDQGNRASVLLTRALPIWPPVSGDKLVSLKYLPKSEIRDRFSGEPSSLGDLLVSANGTGRAGDLDLGCMCARDTLLCALGIHLEQHNALLTAASDRSLVAKVQIKPFGVGGTDQWVRFRRVGD
jgi:hypothetical protein